MAPPERQARRSAGTESSSANAESSSAKVKMADLSALSSFTTSKLTGREWIKTSSDKASGKASPSTPKGSSQQNSQNFNNARQYAQLMRKEYSKSVAARNAQTNEDNSKSGVGFVTINEIGETAAVKDIKYLRLTFDSLDKNGNGVIDVDEMSTYLTSHYDNSLKKTGDPKEKLRSIGTTLVSQLQDRMHEPDLGITFKDLLAMMYTSASKDGLKAMVDCVMDKPPEEKRQSVEIDPQDLEDMNDLWTKWDVGGMGEINEKQFKDVLLYLGLDDPADWDEFYEQIDADGSGSICKDEFIAWWFSDLKFMQGPVKLDV
eukprot:1186599-Prorocentrum_minimum.AAC.2